MCDSTQTFTVCVAETIRMILKRFFMAFPYILLSYVSLYLYRLILTFSGYIVSNFANISSHSFCSSSLYTCCVLYEYYFTFTIIIVFYKKSITTAFVLDSLKYSTRVFYHIPVYSVMVISTVRADKYWK